MHSDKFEKVKSYYDKGFWKEYQVRNAVAKEWITPEEYKEITGNDYPEPNVAREI